MIISAVSQCEIANVHKAFRPAVGQQLTSVRTRKTIQSASGAVGTRADLGAGPLHRLSGTSDALPERITAQPTTDSRAPTGAPLPHPKPVLTCTSDGGRAAYVADHSPPPKPVLTCTSDGGRAAHVADHSPPPKPTLIRPRTAGQPRTAPSTPPPPKPALTCTSTGCVEDNGRL
jgi:hypothetical protein